MKRNLVPIIAILAASLLLSRSQTNKPSNATEPSPPGQILQALEREWAGAVKRRDAEAIDRIQAEEYVFTDPAGRLWTKSRALDTVKAGDLQIDSFDLSEVSARLYDNAAVVTFRIVWEGKYLDKDISGPQRMTDVFVKRDGRWQCVASQATRITPP